MPANVAGTTDAPLDIFGGLVTDMAAADLPQGVSPDCADVAFIQGGVKTRPGLQSVFPALAGNPTVNYLKTYITLNLTQRLLVLDALGNLWKETSPGVLGSVASGLAVNAYGRSATLFGREYLALSDGKFGADLPRQFDDTNFDRVSQVGPGGAPAAADEASTAATLAASPTGAVRANSVANIVASNGAVRASNVVTISTTAAHGFAVGYSVTIAGVTDATFAGTFTIASVPTATSFTYTQSGQNGSSGSGTATATVVTITATAPHGFAVGWNVAIAGVADATFNGAFTIAAVPTTTTFTYTQAAAAASSGAGTATANPIGNIPPGAHKVVVIFQTRQGYQTAPGPPATWTAGGSRRVVVSNIPTGPANVVARILAFTAAGGADYYYVGAGATLPGGNMVIADNTSTSLTVDFSDAILLAGTIVSAQTPGKSLFRLVELGECLGVIDYSQRLFWWGERNKANNWLNLTFDGGWSGNTPLGWTPDVTFGAGGGRESVAVAWGDAYRITGDGATATRGLITQPAVKDAIGVALIAPNTGYSVRARVLKLAALAQGTLHIHLYSQSAGINTTGLQVTAAQAGTSYAEFIAQLTPPLAAIPSDLLLRIYADGTPTNNASFVVDNIQVYPTNQPYNASLVRASRVEDPESCDGVNGILNVAENNGQAVRAAFRLRERLYFVKEHSLYVTEDDGVNEPALWSVSEVSRSVGTPSVNGVDVGEDWVVIADRSGLYIFWGAEPVKISQEIQPTWDSINWQYGHTLWVRVDTRNKRILVGAPLGAAASPNRVLTLDYRSLDNAEEIASRPPIHLTLTGRQAAFDRARKWAPWFVTAASATLAERSDGTAQMFLGNGLATGKVYQLADAQLSDDGAAIASYYTTYFFLHHELEQQLQVGSHRKLFEYLAMFVEGSGTLSLTAYLASSGAASAQQPLALSNPGLKDLELPINVAAERVSFRVGTSAAGAWFRLQKFIPSLRPDPWAPVRGVN